MRKPFIRRRTDAIQVAYVSLAIAILCMVWIASVMAQPPSQDVTNAIVFERLDMLIRRMDRIESYVTAAIVALIANFCAHLVQIRTNHDRRHHGPRFITESDMEGE